MTTRLSKRIKRISMLEEQVKNHHPFCKASYIITMLDSFKDWRCMCDSLKEYDKWRKKPFPKNDYEIDIMKAIDETYNHPR